MKIEVQFQFFLKGLMISFNQGIFKGSQEGCPFFSGIAALNCGYN